MKLGNPPHVKKMSDLHAYFERRTPGDERDFPRLDNGWTRLAVCRRCHLIMTDAEPSTSTGDFYHIAKPHQTRARRCVNEGKVFYTDEMEIMPFLRKARRRYLKRMGIRH